MLAAQGSTGRRLLLFLILLGTGSILLAGHPRAEASENARLDRQALPASGAEDEGRQAREIRVFVAILAVAGLFVGLVIAFGAKALVGITIRAQGGMTPRAARRELVRKVISEHPREAYAPFPDLTERELRRALEEAVEEVVGRAVKYAAKRETVLTRTILVRATLDLTEETEEQPRRQLLVILLKQMERDWFGVYPPSGLLE
jgi:histone H3/H4